MTAHPDDRWHMLLAAYADDELDPQTRAAVERWLTAHPEARAVLRAQRKYSPANWPLWAKVEPKLPTEDAWAAVLSGVKSDLSTKAQPAAPPASRKPWRFVAVLVGAGVAATAAAWFLLAPPAPPQVPAVAKVPVEPPAALAALPISTEADVDLLRLPGGAAAFLPVGVPPLSGRMVLARGDDVRIEDAEPGAAWPGGPPKTTTAPGDTPMIFVTRP